MIKQENKETCSEKYNNYRGDHSNCFKFILWEYFIWDSFHAKKKKKKSIFKYLMRLLNYSKSK